MMAFEHVEVFGPVTAKACEMATLRQQFREALDLALAVYPDAARRGVKVADDGLLLTPADAPIAPRPGI